MKAAAARAWFVGETLLFEGQLSLLDKLVDGVLLVLCVFLLLFGRSQLVLVLLRGINFFYLLLYLPVLAVDVFLVLDADLRYQFICEGMNLLELFSAEIHIRAAVLLYIWRSCAPVRVLSHQKRGTAQKRSAAHKGSAGPLQTLLGSWSTCRRLLAEGRWVKKVNFSQLSAGGCQGVVLLHIIPAS